MTITDTLIVHPGTGTILDAEDGTLIVSIPTDAAAELEDNDQAIVEYAEKHGTPVILRPMYAVAVGEQFDHIDFYGPFPYFGDAESWADKKRRSARASCWVVTLGNPDGEVTA